MTVGRSGDRTGIAQAGTAQTGTASLRPAGSRPALEGRVAVVTGPARGIGRAIARRYACEGAGLDLIRHGITVNTIAPSVVDAEHWDDVDRRFARHENLRPGEKKRRVAAAVPIGRMARPDEIAGLATFLAGDDACTIVARTYGIDGGNRMA